MTTTTTRKTRKMYRVGTSGPQLTVGPMTLAEAKQYVEDHAPLKRGWTGKWTTFTIGGTTRHLYLRFNSKGKPTPRSWNILLTEQKAKR